MKVPKSEKWRQQVGERLSQSLNAIGKKPADISRLFNVSQQALSNYINGKRPLDIELAMKLYARFGLTLDWLYLGDMRSLPYDLAQRIVPRAQLGGVWGATEGVLISLRAITST